MEGKTRKVVLFSLGTDFSISAISPAIRFGWHNFLLSVVFKVIYAYLF